MEAGITRTRNGIPSSKALELTGAGVPSWLLLEKGSIQQAWPWCLWTRSWEWWDIPRGSCSHGISLGMSPSRPVPKPRCILSPCARWMWYFPELPVLLAFVLLQSCRSLPPKLPWSSGIVWGQETWKGSLVGPVGYRVQPVSVTAEGSLRQLLFSIQQNIEPILCLYFPNPKHWAESLLYWVRASRKEVSSNNVSAMAARSAPCECCVPGLWALCILHSPSSQRAFSLYFISSAQEWSFTVIPTSF